MGPAASTGVTCFDVDGKEPQEVVEYALARNVLITTSPCRTSHCRVAPGIVNSEADRFLEVIAAV